MTELTAQYEVSRKTGYKWVRRFHTDGRAGGPRGRVAVSAFVTARKAGTTVWYALADPLIAKLLMVARQIFNNHLVDSQAMLKELRREARR
jgi:hypothetical protein